MIRGLILSEMDQSLWTLLKLQPTIKFASGKPQANQSSAMENAAQAPPCSVSSGARPQRERDTLRDANNQVVANNAEHNIFGGTFHTAHYVPHSLMHVVYHSCCRLDSNLNMVMMFMLLLHFMQYAMRERCGC